MRAMRVDLDVVVDVHPDGREVVDFVALRRQRQQGRRIQCGKGARAAAGQLLKRPLIELFQQRPDRLVDFANRCKCLMPQRARIQRSTTCTADSTLALSCGEYGRAGSTDVP